MSGTDADQRPVPAEPGVPDSPLSTRKTGDADEENPLEEDEKLLPQVRRPADPTFISPNSCQDNNTPTLSSYTYSQPFQDLSTSPHEPYAPNNNAKIQSMLDPQSQMHVIQIWMAAIRQVVSLRDTILTIRMDVKREKTRCSQQEEFFQNIMDAFMALLNSAVEHNTYAQSKNQLDDLARKMQHSREDLKGLRQRSNDIEDGLSRHEYDLTNLEEELYRQINVEYQTNSTQSTSTSSHTSIATQQQIEINESVPSQSARDELYSRLGDLRILLDRLNEFEYELRLELDERDLLRASGQIQISDDATFFEEIRAHRAKLQKELDEAQEDVERLKQVCTRNGIDFEDVQFHSPFYLDEHPDEAASVLSTLAEAARLPLPPSPSGIMDEYFSTQDRVDRWLDSPTNDGRHFTGSPIPDAASDTRHGSLCSGDWVMTHSWPNGRRPSSSRSLGNGAAQPDTPQWNSGPQPGSEHITALLKESMTEPLSQSHKSI